MAESTKYSVLMSVYSKEHPEYLKKSIQSMLDQTLSPNQIVIVKDGPLTIELNEVIDSFIQNYPDLFTIVSLKENVGLGRALNEGLKVCKNELVARMDTDDISLEERCELQVNEFINDNELSIVGTMINEFKDDPQNIVSSRIVPTIHEDIVRFSKRRNPFNHPTVMFKKSAVLKMGGYGDYRRNQDFDLFVRMLNNGYKARNLEKALVLFRANDGNAQRRKSWEKCKTDIKLMFKFWRNGYSSFLDLAIITIIQLVIFISPAWFFDWITKTFLRKKPYIKE